MSERNELIRALVAESGCGPMDVRRALEAHDWNRARATNCLRTFGLAIACKPPRAVPPCGNIFCEVA